MQCKYSILLKRYKGNKILYNFKSIKVNFSIIWKKKKKNKKEFDVCLIFIKKNNYI